MICLRRVGNVHRTGIGDGLFRIVETHLQYCVSCIGQVRAPFSLCHLGTQEGQSGVVRIDQGDLLQRVLSIVETRLQKSTLCACQRRCNELAVFIADQGARRGGLLRSAFGIIRVGAGVSNACWVGNALAIEGDCRRRWCWLIRFRLRHRCLPCRWQRLLDGWRRSSDRPGSGCGLVGATGKPQVADRNDGHSGNPGQYGPFSPRPRCREFRIRGAHSLCVGNGIRFLVSRKLLIDRAKQVAQGIPETCLTAAEKAAIAGGVLPGKR